MKLLLVIFVFVGSIAFNQAFSQDKIFEAKVVNPAKFSESKTAGVFEFMMPSATKKEILEKNAAFYVTFFTVSYDENTHIAKITMVNNDASSRQIINRFFVANKISQIEMAGTLFKVSEFYDKQLK